MNNLALVSIKGRHFSQARNYLTLSSSRSHHAQEVDQNIGRFLNQLKVLEVKKEDLKRIKSSFVEAASYQPDTGWLYMPLDATEKSQAEIQLFCRDDVCEDPSCSICNGFAKLPCKVCNKSGSVLLMGNVSGIFTSQNGYGSVMTSTPSAATAVCEYCRGRGFVDCSKCRDGRDPALKRGSGIRPQITR